MTNPYAEIRDAVHRRAKGAVALLAEMEGLEVFEDAIPPIQEGLTMLRREYAVLSRLAAVHDWDPDRLKAVIGDPLAAMEGRGEG